MTPIELIRSKRAHLARLANQSGSAGETAAVTAMGWIPRPRGKGMSVLLEALKATGVVIKNSSFDAIRLPDSAQPLDFADECAVRSALPLMTFIEIKTANQGRVGEDFKGFFFSLTESEIAASEVLGERHKVALFNNQTGTILLTSIPDILARAKSTTWQVSIQL
jgi:hypothetical protein